MNFKKILSIPIVYKIWQRMVGNYKLWKVYSKYYVKAKEGDRILDIGCGPANVINYLPKDIDYVGFDDSSTYIEDAKKRFTKKNYYFFRENVNCVKDFEKKFDIIMANGILHHIEDSEAEKLISFASKNLKQDGRFITSDGCYILNQSKIRKWILKNDRGKFIRTKENYLKLISKHFSKIEASIREDLYNIPHTMIIFECSN